ncbi:MAG: hypothetical protein ACRD13_13610, partial [Terriglobales bacterium]
TQVPGRAHNVGRIYYTDSWEDPRHYQPDVFVDITPVYQTWLHAASADERWRGGIEDFAFAKYYEALTVVRGAVAGFPHAQAFRAAENTRELRSWEER